MLNNVIVPLNSLQRYLKYGIHTHKVTKIFLLLTKKQYFCTQIMWNVKCGMWKVESGMRNDELEERVKRAVDNFMAGYGCCQSVVAAFADLYGLDDTLAKKVAAGFGGGVGRMRMMCGAVSGIVMLVGLDCGQTEGSDREGKSACYKVVQELLAKSKEDNGSLICAEILGLEGHEKAVCHYEASPRTAEYYKTRPCAAKVESAARIFAEYLQKVKRQKS